MPVPSTSQNSPPSNVSSSTPLLVSPYKHELIALLGIPPRLTGTGDVSLSLAYQKYRAFLIAFQTYEDMVKTDTWTIARLTKTNIIELFVSKSFFHSHYKRYFPKVAEHEDMMGWLNEDEDRVCDIDVWGIKKNVYTFTDLALWLENGGTLEVEDQDYDGKKKKATKGKEKRKEKVKVQEKRKDKGKEREHEKEKKQKSHKKGKKDIHKSK